MAEAKASMAKRLHQRPLSPHLTIFRLYINMTMSIVHRITGAANYFGSLLLALWLIAAAAGDERFAEVSSLLHSPPGLVILFGFTWSVLHHMVGGLRHFIWDFGKGFSLSTIRLLSWGTLVVSLVLTGAVWFAIWTYAEPGTIQLGSLSL